MRPETLEIVDKSIAEFERVYAAKLNKETLSVVWHEDRYPMWICEYTSHLNETMIVVAHIGGFMLCTPEQFDGIQQYHPR